MPATQKHLRDLFTLFASVKTEKEARSLLEDILTPQELDAVAERWQIVRALHSGKPQRTIARSLKLSISKITRGSRMLQYGSGGFQLFLKRMGKKRD